MDTIILIFAFFAAFLFFNQILNLIYLNNNMILRINKYIKTNEKTDFKPKKNEYKKGLGIIAKGVGSAKFLNGYKRRISSLLVRAHILLKPEEYITVCIITASIGAAIGLLSFKSPVLAALTGIAGWIFPGMYVKAQIKKRTKIFNEQLCDAIVLISNSLKAGYSFFQAVDIVASEMTGPISEEFHTLQREINLGLDTEKALENLVERVKSDDLELLVTAVLIQRQVGGNLSEILDNISSTIRDRIKLKGEIRTVTAQGRTSGLIIALLPPILCAILFLVNRDYIILLFRHPIGLAILGVSVFMELLGIYFINKVVKIEM